MEREEERGASCVSSCGTVGVDRSTIGRIPQANRTACSAAEWLEPHVIFKDVGVNSVVPEANECGMWRVHVVCNGHIDGRKNPHGDKGHLCSAPLEIKWSEHIGVYGARL